jgi:glycosyltransferase involved in cell wall biosynthesis
MHFHLLSFEGPDAYARAGGLSSRVTGLGQQLAELGFETHLWFIGDPRLPGHEQHGNFYLQRFCQWISAFHPGGVYDGEAGKQNDYSASLPPELFRRIERDLRRSIPVTIMAEEWHTVNAVLHLNALLVRHHMRHRVRILWNANNTFGFEHIDWAQLEAAATITTVSRYMKHAMQRLGADPVVIPNGLEPTAFEPVEAAASAAFCAQISRRLLLAKVARFDPDKRWLATVEIVAALKARGARPLLVARGGVEAHGHEVLDRARSLGLKVSERRAQPGAGGLVAALEQLDEVDVLHLTSHLDPEARRLLFRCASAVLANSSHENRVRKPTQPSRRRVLQSARSARTACQTSSPSRPNAQRRRPTRAGMCLWLHWRRLVYWPRCAAGTRPPSWASSICITPRWCAWRRATCAIKRRPKRSHRRRGSPSFRASRASKRAPA